MPIVRFMIPGLLLFLCLSGATLPVWAQERCGTVEYTEKLKGKDGETTTAFEQWLRSRMRVKAQSTNGTGRTKNSLYKIPVVVHVIHSGVSHSSNISDAQILSQIRVLNEDYNRLNSDANNTPAVFSSVAGDAQIEFVLAKRTPEGLPTNGIVRVQGPKSSWTVSDNYTLKSLSYWPAEDYLNIWVCNLTDYLGYAQFPQSDLLDGLQNSSSNRVTDGVVITHTAFGSVEDGNFNLQGNYNRGRTTTHEIGHFFGLRHIWGDDNGSCGGDGDYVDDTPDQADRTLNCPSHPRTSCGVTSMFQNFLDYTNDACMNLFTQGQVERMAIILENSPRRSSLTTSPALLDPQPVANDLGVRGINVPATGECSGEVTPSIEVRNYGNNAITSATIRILQNGTPLETTNFNLNLPQLESTHVSFSPVNVSSGTHTFRFEILTTNGVADGNGQNNILERAVFVPANATIPVVENLQTLPPAWQTINPDGLFTWEHTNAINGQPNNKALKINFYDYEDNEGEIDIYLSPVLDLSSATAGLVLFDVAYAQYQNSGDGLRVVVLSNCNTDVTQGTIVYEKYGSALATRPRKDGAYIPQGASDWRTEILSLDAYLGQSGIQLAFVGVNDWGNNLYLDNIRILTEDFANVSLKQITSPPPLVCTQQVTPIVVVRNSGTAISALDIQYTVNGTSKTYTVNGLNLGSAQETTIELPKMTLVPGANNLIVTLSNPDGIDDVDPSDNSTSLEVVFNNKTTPIPFQENFEGDFQNKWTILNPQGNPSWQEETFSGNKALVYQGFNNLVIGDEAWLVGPVMDLSATESASVVFDVSYATRQNIHDVLEVRASTGCEKPFQVMRSFSGSDLSVTTSSQSWRPSEEAHWNRKTFVDLSGLAGESSARLAFVVTNQNGNNLYLDNVRLYLSDDPSPVDVDGPFSVYPSPLSRGEDLLVSFNLEELGDVILDITDSMGRQVFSGAYNAILNQTLTISTTNYSSGLYLVRVVSGRNVYHSKFVIDR